MEKRGDVLKYDEETLKKIQFLNEYGVIESRIRILRDRLENHVCIRLVLLNLMVCQKVEKLLPLLIKLLKQ